ncbi:MAG: ATP-dependent Clp protease adaptor ClpS [Polyangiaceae bacterium]|nr:ATP-dependent Clp protease adaptor ClpS [Polyangiaceae bacterium]
MSHQTHSDSDVLEKDSTCTRAPRRFNVILHNDDYTVMDFVQQILVAIFHHPPAAAAQLMLQVHTNGHAIAGTYTKDIAETKAHEAIALAREHGFPMRCSVEPAD